jgi:glycerophosphoryl diester phosphodiesterase
MVEEKKSNRRWKAHLHYFMALILFLHCLFFIIYWMAVGNFRNDVNQYIANAVGWQLPYTGIIITLTVLIGFWSLIRFFIFRVRVKKDGWKPSTINWIYFGVWLLFLSIFYLSFVIVLSENPSQRGVIIQLLNLTRVFGDVILFLLAAVWLRKLIQFLRRKSVGAAKNWLFNTGVAFSLMLIVALWLVPAIFPPNWAFQGDLPPKPVLLAHRGASMLAPENTLAAVDLAADYQAFGFETDLRISWDGVIFLMHDETLNRTTNISEVYPDRVDERAESFTMDQLKELNAGLWFIQKDPFNTIENGLVSQAQLSINQGQEIPTLSETIELIKVENLVFLFDLRYPDVDHPYYDEYFELVFNQCQESGLNGNIWFLVDQEQLGKVIDEAPQMTRVIGVTSANLPPANNLADQKYEIINVDTGIRSREIKAYRAEGLGVNVYTIDQTWLFSQFWLSGVTSVTTNSVHTFSELDQPLLSLPYSRYLLIWGLLGIVVAIWLASSQPQREPEPPKPMETPDLLDFAGSDEDMFIDLAALPEIGLEDGENINELPLTKSNSGTPETLEETQVDEHSEGSEKDSDTKTFLEPTEEAAHIVEDRTREEVASPEETGEDTDIDDHQSEDLNQLEG